MGNIFKIIFLTIGSIYLITPSNAQTTKNSESSSISFTYSSDITIHILKSNFSEPIYAYVAGDDTVTVTGVNITGDLEFSLLSTPYTPFKIPPNKLTRLVIYGYDPDQLGTRNASLIIESNAEGNPHILNITAETVGGFGPWDWKFLELPDGNKELYDIVVDPEDDNIWYVNARKLYITRDAGKSWVNPDTSANIWSGGYAVIDPTNPSRVYRFSSTIDSDIYLNISNDKGLNWTRLEAWHYGSGAMTVSPIDGSIFIASSVGINGDEMNPGVFISRDNGLSWNFHSFGIVEDRVIAWDIAQDPISGAIFVCTEIGDHPQPYEPPFFRSLDNGFTWEDVSDDLYHGVSIQIDTINKNVFFQTEGSALYKSSDLGNNWEMVSNPGLWELLVDNSNNRIFGGKHVYRNWDGGVYISYNQGFNWELAGLRYLPTLSIALNGTHTKLFVASYGVGLFTCEIPDTSEIKPKLELTPNTSFENQILYYLIESTKDGTVFIVSEDATEELKSQSVTHIDSFRIVANIPDTIFLFELENNLYHLYIRDFNGNTSDTLQLVDYRIDPPILVANDTVLNKDYIEVTSSKNAILSIVDEGIYDFSEIKNSPIGGYDMIADTPRNIWISLLNSGTYWLYARENDGTLSYPKAFHYIKNTVNIKDYDRKQIDIDIYPNPTNNVLIIKGVNTPNSVKIYSLNGVQLLSVINSNENQKINVSQLKSGIYILKIETIKEIVLKTFIKQ